MLASHLILILAIHDRKPLPEADALGVPPQDAIADGMKCSSPNALGALRQQATATRSSISRAALLVKVSSRMPARGHALLEQPGHPISQGARLSTARAGDNQGRPRGEVTAASCWGLSSAA